MQLVCDAIPRALGIPRAEVQVVTPVHRGPAGTVALNAALKARLNPGDGAVGGFDVGDRVVATANHLDGRLRQRRGRRVTSARVRRADGRVRRLRPVDVPARAVGDLAHGWAVTVHRAQGSEFPAVVAVLPAEAGGLLSRPLVYTAFTRAQRHLSRGARGRCRRSPGRCGRSARGPAAPGSPGCCGTPSTRSAPARVAPA